MSHMAKIEIIVKNLAALQDACNELGWQFLEGQTTYAWFGRYMNDWPLPDSVTVDQLGKCDHAIRVPNCDYEIGLVWNYKLGGYQIVYDFWKAGGLVQVLGENGGPLRKAYAVNEIKNIAKKKRWRLAKESDIENGKRLVLRV